MNPNKKTKTPEQIEKPRKIPTFFWKKLPNRTMKSTICTAPV